MVTAVRSRGGDGGSGAEDEHSSDDNNGDSVQLIQVLRQQPQVTNVQLTDDFSRERVRRVRTRRRTVQGK